MGSLNFDARNFEPEILTPVHSFILDAKKVIFQIQHTISNINTK